MKEEDGNGTETSTCLSSESQAIELEFIKKYESLPILWDVKHPDYTNKYRRCVAIDALLKIIKKWDSSATRPTVRQKINVLRSSYRKDLRKHLASKIIGPDGQEIYEYNPKNWKFHALKFLGGKLHEDVKHIKSRSILEVNLDNINFQDEASEESEREDELATQVSDVLQTIRDDKSYKQSHTKKKRMKVEVQDYLVEDTIFDRELEAIGSNVACKLKRMNPNQRCHAELLINKVLIDGLKNKLTDDTDLTEVYK